MDRQAQKQQASLIIKNASEVVTCSGTDVSSVERIPGGWVAIAGEQIIAVGTGEEVTAKVDIEHATTIDATGKVVAPGFVDCHTHLVFGGSRVQEYAAKMTIDDPAELKRLGIQTGILASVEMTRKSSEEQLFHDAQDRLVRMLNSGTTTVESKSGYGLSTTEEIKMLNVNAKLAKAMPVDIVSTFLGAHGWPAHLPKEVYMGVLLDEMIPWISGLGLATYCDVWCDDGHYSAAESEKILRVAADAGLQPKIHTDAYSYVGGSDLACDMKMVSADHLNYTPPAVMQKLANTGVTGVLMPALDFAVKHPRPFDARAMIDSGMTVALATNLCPGCWTESMQFVMVLACRLYRMTPAEALRAATIGGAMALGLGANRGTIEVGKLADLQIWNVPSFEHVIYQLGGNVVERVIKRGKQVVDRSALEKWTEKVV
ncbi:imidazolonepropionase [Brevibacillus sp. NRS-1366]|uniref:imidazolonepropionase n=1 Tax=Brevibacillus sp. NRS-1366 TaxID=3233899 RepID=UPI003D20B34A